MAQRDQDRFFTMAECYDKMVNRLLPRYDWLQDELIELIFADGLEDKFIIDLGAGSGIFLDKVLTRYPAARCSWVDYSDDFLAVAQRKLAKYGRRVDFVLVPLGEPWEARLNQVPDVICSMSAIHHLDTAGKQDLYHRCHAVLAPGGWLFNLDEMAAVYPDAYMKTLHYWVRHVERAAADVPEILRDACDAWQAQFRKWQVRNIDHADEPKSAGDDMHEGHLEQMRWLREIGFVEVDLFFKFQRWCAIGGRKRAAGSGSTARHGRSAPA